MEILEQIAKDMTPFLNLRMKFRFRRHVLEVVAKAVVAGNSYDNPNYSDLKWESIGDQQTSTIITYLVASNVLLEDGKDSNGDEVYIIRNNQESPYAQA